MHSLSKQKMLVTGGAGFIGGNFVQYMIDKYPHYDIVNLDLLTYAGDLTKHKDIESKSNYRFVQADIADRGAIMSLFELEKFDYVVHFAAESHVDRSITDPAVFVRTNVMGTQVLLDAAKNSALLNSSMSLRMKCMANSISILLYFSQRKRLCSRTVLIVQVRLRRIC